MRVSLTQTRSRRSSPASASAASAAKNAADDGSPGTAVSSGSDRELDVERHRRRPSTRIAHAARREHALRVVARSRPARSRARERPHTAPASRIALLICALATALFHSIVVRGHRRESSSAGRRAPAARSSRPSLRAAPRRVASGGDSDSRRRRSVARTAAGDDAGHEARRRAAVAAVEVRRRLRSPRSPTPAHDEVRRQLRNRDAERAQHAGGGLHVRRLQDARDRATSPSASAPRISARCEIDLSPGTRSVASKPSSQPASSAVARSVFSSRYFTMTGA